MHFYFIFLRKSKYRQKLTLIKLKEIIKKINTYEYVINQIRIFLVIYLFLRLFSFIWYFLGNQICKSIDNVENQEQKEYEVNEPSVEGNFVILYLFYFL